MAWKHGVKVNNNIIVRKTDSSGKGGFQVRFIGRIAVAVRDDTRVYIKVTMPCFKTNLRNWFASVYDDDLDIGSEGYTWLAVGHVPVDQLFGDLLVTLSHLWGKNPDVVAEQRLDRSVSALKPLILDLWFVGNMISRSRT